MVGSSSGFACWLLLVISIGQNSQVTGGCSGKCCRGRDLSCSTTDWRMDRLYETCYCDESCVKTKDCCFDYFTECPAQDCAVSDWSHWSGCAKPCQLSVRSRVRHIEQKPTNGGEPCPCPGGKSWMQGVQRPQRKSLWSQLRCTNRNIGGFSNICSCFFIPKS
ncbi:Somatomedin-B and thrombospondin type-1 domain-containing protein [Oryzias melastigma]|uniref:Somatomedin-B and thrombospondin type-1 domain-containing protein n=1 Tax=Oryzias melastigma TaxID=30732 RepID=A0A834C501_ORYME|nr:Somatomedin-B and thrombospondin type-1 domain-containing protein [Oryzias melastigma]